ncbi:MAG: diguanylate cyclase [Elusimicrobiota bacterium]
MTKATSRVRESLYGFHKELNRPFSGEEQLLERALRLIAERVRADRISTFHLAPGDEKLSLQFCLHFGQWLEMDEEIHLAETSPLRRLVRGRTRHLSYTTPHAVLYVPLRWASGSEDSTLGVLRLERFSSRAPFRPAGREFAELLAAELAQNLARSRVGLARQSQLKRFEAVTDLAAVFASSLRVEDGLRLILEGIVRHFGLDRVRLYLVDREKGVLRGELGVDLRGRSMSLRTEEIPLDSEVHRFSRILRGEDPDTLMKRYEDRVLYLPLTVQANKTGLLVADNFLSQQTIAGEDIGLLRSFAGQIALAVDNARLFDEVQALSLYDSLTGLPVRRYFNQRFQEELYRVERSDQALSVAMIDIDFFKSINDTYGHQIGDLALKEVGRIILKRLRKIDFPSRYGGDEILILLPQADSEGACNILSRLLEDIRGIRIPVPFSREGELDVRVSIGIATYPEDGRTAEDLVKKADEALYWVKSRGRDGLSTFRQAVAEWPSLVDK